MKIKSFFLALLFLIPLISFSKSNWKTSPFEQKVFIENKGQFNDQAGANEEILYQASFGRVNMYFTKQGVIYQYDEMIPKSRETEEEDIEVKHHTLQMQWMGISPSVNVTAEGKVSAYYTYAVEAGKEMTGVKANGYKRIIYRNLYPNIDVEYIFPKDKGGVKYSLILRPGANVSDIKMKWNGESITQDALGNIVVKSSFGDFIDHAPNTFYEGGENIKSAFELSGNIVSFKLQTVNNKLQTVIIDPWTTTPTGLTTNNAAFDVDYDYDGNVYVAGGGYPYKLSKYSPQGYLDWTFIEPGSWGVFYTRFCLLRKSGTSFIGEASTNSTARVMKISTNGFLQITSPAFTGTAEIWKMVYNQCTGQLIGFGGGIYGTNSVQLIADTNLTSGSALNFNGFTGSCCNDITSVVEDNNGDFFAMTTSASGLPAVDDKIMKSLASSGYNPPCAFNVSSTYDFNECTNSGIPGFSGGCGSGTVRSNALALNASYLYGWDGQTLTAWNKTTGALLSSYIVNGGYAAGQLRTHEGIAADECNNVYFGGTNQVHVFSFNGTTFTPGTSLTAGLMSEVYDVCLGRGDKLYACGAGFVCEIQLTATTCNSLGLTASATGSSCSASTGTATATVTGGSAPYTYSWSPGGQTTATATGLAPDTYTVTVTDASSSACSSANIQTATVVVTGSTMVINVPPDYYICAEGSGSVQLTASGGTTYTWSPSATLDDSTVANPIASPFVTTTYTVIVSNGSCSDTAQVTVHIVSPPATPHVTQQGDTLFCTPAGFAGYQWYFNGSPISGGTDSFYVAIQAGAYAIKVTDSLGCTVISNSYGYLAVSEISEGGIKIYPNPAGDQFTVSGLQFTVHATLDIYNVIGEKVYSDAVNNNLKTINCKPFSKGVYVIQITATDKIYRTKFIKD